MTTPKPEDAPEGFWEEFAQWATSEGNKQSVLDAFLTSKGKQAPAPQPKEGGEAATAAEAPPKRKGWFGNAD